MKNTRPYSKFLLAIIFSVASVMGHAQTGTLKGKVKNAINNESIAFANVFIEGTNYAITTNFDGEYIIENIEPGVYNITATSIGYDKTIISEISIGSAGTRNLDIEMNASVVSVNTVKIEASPFRKTEEAPVSLRTISATEIYRNPGGNRDISRVLQTLPGVSSSVSFRNDIIVRGGAPNENRFFLDGIEVPNINHFATQGSSGGPVGLINVNFIEEVEFFSGAFPVSKGNALSSVISFKQIDGNDDKLKGNFMLGSSDIGLTLDGPIGDKSTFILSVRRSYLQFLFKALGLPFLPTYNDMQAKIKTRINDKNELTIIGLGAIDDFTLNTNVNENITDQETIDQNNYILGFLPINTQWNYATGLNWKHFGENSFQNYILSRNHLSNKSIKYQNNIETEDQLILDYMSEEIETKARFEHTYRADGWKVNAGLGIENGLYRNDTYNRVQIADSVAIIDFESELTLNRFALFGSVARKFYQDRLTVSAGIRTDFNDYSNEMNNPLKQLSPRLSMSYALTEKLYLNANIGRYYQLPAYTILGYRNQNQELVNKTNGITYISNDQYVIGLEYNPQTYLKVSGEFFLKNYSNYPFSLTDSISLANLGADFGVIGNDEINSNSEGRAYGFELLIQQKLSDKIYGILSYTYVRSEFTDKNGEYIPSAWDNRHILNLTAGRKFDKNWEIGARFRLLGGAPYTPIDVALSSQIDIWNVTRTGILDYDKLNSERLPLSHGLDIRIDKKYFFDNWSANIYLDIQNLYNFQAELPAFLNVQTDENNTPIVDPDNPNAYSTYFIQNNSGTVLPSIGVMIEF